MKRIPHAQGVSRALRSARAAVQKALKSVNLAASQRMANGDYTAAEGLAKKGKDVRGFLAEVEALQSRWRETCGGGGGAQEAATTPLWLYYQPVLRSLVQAGGQARRAELEVSVEALMRASFLPGDREATSHGQERWKVMIRRARKPLIAEGWIEDRLGLNWKITEAGRRAAEKQLSKDPASRK